ncbi:MAG: DUF2088 domain-containing protein [Clostridiales bacterium]|nr:DUF2088 domain-containing protein [Clostridiales bacterium]
MVHQSIIASVGRHLSQEEIYDGLGAVLENNNDIRKVLLIPPDNTRSQSGADLITAWYYKTLSKKGINVKVLPSLGTHMAMTEQELHDFFGKEIPLDAYIVHDYINDVVKIGTIPVEFVKEVSEGLVDEKIDVQINKVLLDKSFDLILSIGQVVPHEVVGMANYSKNIFVGCGGEHMINSTHLLGAVYGMEKVMGQDHSPVRKVFDYAEEHFIQDMPIVYVLTVCTAKMDDVYIHGLFVGRDRKLFEDAVQLSQQLNMTYVEKAPKKMVVYLDEHEFKTTWVGNKAIYRTRMAIADGGELIIITPGIRKCGESDEPDRLIRKYGYKGRMHILDELKKSRELQDNQSIAAHLIHGSSDGRFKITYAPKQMSKEEILEIGFDYIDYEDALEKYPIHQLEDGWNNVDGEEIFYISNPAIGLWVEKKRLTN